MNALSRCAATWRVSLPIVLTAVLAGCHYTRRTTVFGHVVGGVDAQRVETMALAISPGGTLELSTPHGEITVRAEAVAEAKLTATLRSSGRTKEEAEEVLARYSLAVDEDAATVKVAVHGEPTSIRSDGSRLSIGASVDFVVTVPQGTALRLDTSTGNVTAIGPFGPCRINARYGSIDLEGAAGEVALHSDSGDVTLRDAGGGDVVTDSGYGALRLEKVAATSLRATSKSGDVTLHDARADLVALATSYGSIRVRGLAGELRAETQSGDVEVEGVRGAVNVRTQYGKVAVEGELTGVDARSSSGSVAVRVLAGSTNATAWQMSSSYGAVSLWVPAGFGCEFAAFTQYGEIDCDFPMTVEGGRHRSGAVKGAIGGGGPAVTLTTGSGDIQMKKL